MRRKHVTRRRARAIAVSAVGVLTAAFLGVGTADADPQADPATARIESIDKSGEQHWTIDVYSPSMDTVVPLDVLRPADTSVPRPILYVLNGAGIGVVKGSGWVESTDIVDFFSDKNVNVVSPFAGNFSYYTDWVSDDPVLGRNKWETFLTEEIPPLLDAALGADGVQSIMGMSMSAGSALDLAARTGDFYSGVASFSGCVRVSDPLGKQYVKTVVEGRGDGNVDNMWGPDGDPQWIEHDVYLNAEKLRGKALYVTSRNGAPGPFDTPGNARISDDPNVLPVQIVLGGGIELATGICTQQLVDKLGELDIPVTADVGAPGTHSWGYWEQDLRKSWPVLARSMGVEN